jgi:hypothetical protein
MPLGYRSIFMARAGQLPSKTVGDTVPSPRSVRFGSAER